MLLSISIMLATLSIVGAYTDLGSGVCECEAKFDCKKALEDSACKTVNLNTSTLVEGSFIEDIEKFQNKTFSCNGNTIEGAGSEVAFKLEENSGNVVKKCVIKNFKHAFELEKSYNNSIGKNIIEENSDDAVVLKRSSGNNIRNNNITNNGGGIILTTASEENKIKENNITSNKGDGIEIKDSNFNLISRNTISNSKDEGIDIESSSKNRILNNFIDNNLASGIKLEKSKTNNIVRKNKVSANKEGILLKESDREIILKNKIWNNEIGLKLEDSNQNKFRANEIFENKEIQIELEDSQDNLIYNNLFSALKNQELAEVDHHYNRWNLALINKTNIINGSFIGGNFWKHEGSGFSETCEDLDSNGICDEKFILNENNLDKGPLTI